jgi:hypothetical protein
VPSASIHRPAQRYVADAQCQRRLLANPQLLVNLLRKIISPEASPTSAKIAATRRSLSARASA